MYRYIDRPVASAGEAPRLLVLAMRDWVAAASRRRCPVDAIMPRLLAHRLIGALEPFHFIMGTLAVHGRSRLCFGCPCQQTVSEGEAVLLAAFLDGSTGAHYDWLVGPGHCARLAEAVGAVRSALALAGLLPASR